MLDSTSVINHVVLMSELDDFYAQNFLFMYLLKLVPMNIIK